MKPFEEDLREQLRAKWSTLADRLGIHFDDLHGLSTGEASLALLRLPPNAPGQDIRAATSLLLDVTGNLDKAKALLAKARAGLKGRGAKRPSKRLAESLSTFSTSRCPRASRLRPGRRRGGRSRNGPDGLFPHQ